MCLYNNRDKFTLPSHVMCHSPNDAPPHHDGWGGVFLSLRQALVEENLTVRPPNYNTPIVIRQIESHLKDTFCASVLK